MMDSLYNLVFHCRHKRLSFPFRRPGKEGPQTYVVCLDCAKEFPYDWEHMRVGRAADIPERAAAKSKLRYLAWAPVLSALWLAGSALRLRSRKRADPRK